MVLLNAIYFKGRWLNQFVLKQTYKADFYLANGSAQKVDMMRLNEELIFKRNPAGLQVLTCQFPYVGESLAMTIILPHEGFQLSEFEKKLNEKNLNNILLSNVEKTEVYVYIPKFKFKFQIEVN